MKRGTEHECTISALAYKGFGIAFEEGRFPIFVKRGLPGSRVRIRLTKVRKRFAEGVILEELETSPTARPPRCPHTALCGGCTFQTLPYMEQRHWKERFVYDALERIGDWEVNSERCHTLVEADTEWEYRNKMEYSFGVDRFYDEVTFAKKKEEGSLDDGFYLGLHTPGSFSKVEHITHCALQHPLGDALRNAIWQWTKESGLPCYNQRAQEGIWRHLLLRIGYHTKEVLVNIVASDLPDPKETLLPLAKILEELCTAHGHTLAGVVYTNNNGKNDNAVGKPMETIVGREFLYERLGAMTYKISSFSFFQVNTPMAERLYQHVADLLQGVRGTVLDLYCGAGSIGIFLSPYCDQIIGVEKNEGSIIDAKENAARNDIQNITFHAALVEDVVGTELCPVDNVAAVVVDPPREGLHPKVIPYLLSLDIERLVYVSCNPTTLARDLKELQVGGYEIHSVTPFDLFPQTYHVETVVELRKKHHNQ